MKFLTIRFDLIDVVSFLYIVIQSVVDVGWFVIFVGFCD